MAPERPSEEICIIFLNIPNAYPTRRNTSKNKLLPLAVLDKYDFLIDIGQESPKQSMVIASINSVISDKFITIFLSCIDTKS